MQREVTVYVWDRCLLLQAGTLVVDRRQKPYKRLSATIIVANKRPFVLEAGGQPAREYQGVLIAPNVLRKYLEAADADLTILDAGITSAAYQDLEPALVKGEARALRADELQRLRSLVSDAFASEIGCAEAIRLFEDVVHAIRPARARAIERDARIGRVMELIEAVPFDEMSLSKLAREVGLSESRLRELFRKSVGCAISQYMRWVAAWKAIKLWKQGMTFTDVAHAVGFHDLAHADHALAETFGMSPSEMTRISLHRCDP